MKSVSSCWYHDEKFFHREFSVNLPILLLRASGFAALWWVLSEGDMDGWGLGAVAVALATWTSWAMLPPASARISPIGLLRFLLLFVWNSLRGGLQVAGMALRGRKSLCPKVLEIPVTLPPGGVRVLLVNAIGLMPGTQGVSLEEDTLRLHVLDERQPIVAEVNALAVAIGQIYGDER